MSSSLKTRQLQLTNETDYEIYKMAIALGLIEPIIIEDRKDLRSEVTWRERIEPYQHQISNLISFCRRLPVALLTDDVGLGKTISAGLVVSELMSRGRVSKFLIVCPKLIMPQWEEELRTKFNIASVQASGNELLKASPPEDRGAIITTYNSARMYLDKIVENGFDMLILDEAHKLRNLFGTEKSPQVAQKIQSVLSNRNFKFVLMLTATPIQNRLWDIYSLVHLLSVARGHENPFGTEGMFARKFIADNRQEARHLKLDKKEEFRSIVYSHMSRTRRADAQLSFPDRIVQQHKVKPTEAELALISAISEPIQKLNRLAQISIAQALISSPHALAAQLETMARNETVPKELAIKVREIVNSITVTAKLKGLEALVSKLQSEQSAHWRMVIFTTRRETQTTIEAFLSEKGIKCGLINGSSGGRNKDTLEKFRSVPPELHVIVSTEAGSEGINLQVANVIVNYDLPWNPMVVEQRIGRVQRLASNHANVCVFNVTLQGTFEEYIVGRLMEKLQMASHAIGDIDALLDAAGIDEEGGEGFEEKIRDLVIQALAGKNVEAAIKLQEQSILKAKAQLESEENNINDLLGKKSGSEYTGPKCPKLEKQIYPLDLKTFSKQALNSVGGKCIELPNEQYQIELDGASKIVTFSEQEPNSGSQNIFRPGDPLFERLISRVANNGKHVVEDLDKNITATIEKLGSEWPLQFNAKYSRFKVEQITPCFSGTALVRARVTVAHDSYERLIEVHCSPEENLNINSDSLDALPKFIFNPETLGITSNSLIEKTKLEENIAEFCRFYNERLKHELQYVENSERLQKKLEDDFTPRLQTELVGFKGTFFRKLKVSLFFTFDTNDLYQTQVEIVPSQNELKYFGSMEVCAKSKNTVPANCLDYCQISKAKVLKHFLLKSDSSGRMALAEYVVNCEVSGKKLLIDEVQKSSVTHKSVDASILKKSIISGKFAEPEYFGKCEFSGDELLKSELAVSEFSGKKYRIDQQLRSKASNKLGHKSEFIFCDLTSEPLAATEASRCEITGKLVLPGMLETCEVSGKKVLPSELVRCVETRKKVVKSLCVNSSISSMWIIESEAVRSVSGKFCTKHEANVCSWTGQVLHPDDAATCKITELSFQKNLVDKDFGFFTNLFNLLRGTRVRSDGQEYHGHIATLASRVFNNEKPVIESVELSSDGKHAAVCLKLSAWFGFSVKYVGFLYSVNEKSISGQFKVGKRDGGMWTIELDRAKKKLG